MNKWLIVLGLMILVAMRLSGQTIPLSISHGLTSKSDSFSPLVEASPTILARFQPSLLAGTSWRFAMPGYVQKNPRGYSPLCRTELLLEDQLPIAPWVKLSSTPREAGFFQGNANFVLKVKGF